MTQVKSTPVSKTPVSKTEVKVEEVKTPKVGIGSTVVEMILKNPEMSNEAILKEVRSKFESAQTSYACIAWYKSKLRKEGRIGPRVFAKKTAVKEATV